MDTTLIETIQTQQAKESVSLNASAEKEAVETIHPQSGGIHQEKEMFEKVGRNDPCPCGSGKKFKKCHGA